MKLQKSILLTRFKTEDEPKGWTIWQQLKI